MARPVATFASGGDSALTARRVVLVLGEGRADTHPLPDGGTLTVGRDADSEVQLIHPKISRRHACFRGGPPVSVEDLGSTNGIRVGNRRLAANARAELVPGESVQLGPFMVVVLDAPREHTVDAQPLAFIRISDPTPRGVPEVAARIARGTVSVLITGETGAGKEVLARTLHQLSERKGAFVAINCATINESLLESELFGYERGAFTGATQTKPGLFELAGGGTVFLDEIGDLPSALQAKLLRVLETREVYRLGGVKPMSLDVRFISATHFDLGQEVLAGRFRRDLFFRANGINLNIEPLRDRRQAIAALAGELLETAARAAGRAPPRLHPSALGALLRHDWPGNVRELRTVIDRALLLATGDEILPVHFLFDRLPTGAEANAAEGEVDRVDQSYGRAVDAAAAEHRGNVTAMAHSLGTSRSQVRRLVQKYRIELGRYRR